MKNKTNIAKFAVSLALCVCIAILGMIVSLSTTLWSEGWMIRSMEKTEYFDVAEKQTKIDCGVIVSQMGILGNFVDPFVTNQMIRDDITLATDSLYRNVKSHTMSRFGSLAEKVENAIYDDTGKILGESEKQTNAAIQFQVEQQYAENMKLPFQPIVSILLQYKQIGGYFAIAVAVIAVGAVVTLFRLSETMLDWKKNLTCSGLAAGATLVLMAAITALSGYKKWMPQGNMGYDLFVEWFGGLSVAFLGFGVLIMVAVVGMYLLPQKSKGRV